MSGRPPTEIWEDALDEGERRLERGTVALAVTGLLGGVEVMFGVIALVVSTAALGAVMPQQTAHLPGRSPSDSRSYSSLSVAQNCSRRTSSSR